MLMVAIDPSLVSLGLAVLESTGKPHLLQHIKQHNTAANWHARALQMATAVQYTLSQNLPLSPFAVLVETPANWFCERGQDSKNSEAVQKLYFVTGAICASLFEIPACRGIWSVDPGQWKGQSPKSVMLTRAQRYCARYDINLMHAPSDVAEALLLGVYGLKHQEPTDGSSLRFSEPIIHLFEGCSTARVGNKMDSLYSLCNFRAFSITNYCG